MSETTSIRNIGPQSMTWLSHAGISSREDLVRRGVVPTYLLLKSKYPQVSLNLLWAMEGAVTNQDWRLISDETKQRLLNEISLLE